MSACIIFTVVVVAIIFAAVGAGAGSHVSLARKGRPARGILLEVSSTATRAQSGGFKSYPVERRQALVEVELPGQPPVEVRVGLLVPLNLSALVLPGATVELRVHKSHLKSIAVVGPGSGFAFGGVMPAPAAVPAQVQAQLPGRTS